MVAELFFHWNLDQDINTIYRIGVWTIADPEHIYNSPCSYGILICLKNKGSYPYTHIIMIRAEAKIIYRTCDIELRWSNWMEL